jgi:hypothetical protein
MQPREQQLLTDQQLRDASIDQIEDLVQRINMELQKRGRPGVVWSTTPEDRPGPSDPLGPGNIGSE